MKFRYYLYYKDYHYYLYDRKLKKFKILKLLLKVCMTILNTNIIYLVIYILKIYLYMNFFAITQVLMMKRSKQKYE